MVLSLFLDIANRLDSLPHHDLERYELNQYQRTPRGNDPFEIFFNDPFFSRNITNVKKNLDTPSITVDVKSLPEDGKPVGFTGAVGNYNFSATIDRTDDVQYLLYSSYLQTDPEFSHRLV